MVAGQKPGKHSATAAVEVVIKGRAGERPGERAIRGERIIIVVHSVAPQLPLGLVY